MDSIVSSALTGLKLCLGYSALLIGIGIAASLVATGGYVFLILVPAAVSGWLVGVGVPATLAQAIGLGFGLGVYGPIPFLLLDEP